MSEGHNLRGAASALSHLVFTSPALFELTSRTMELQPAIDPTAGYGKMQIAYMLVGMFDDSILLEADGDRIAELFAERPIRFYVFVRALGHQLLTQQAAQTCINGQRHPNYGNLNSQISKFDPSWRSAKVAELLLRG